MRPWITALALAVLASAVAGGRQAPLPEREAFFAQVRARLAGNAVLQVPFRYKERKTDIGMNPFGRMGTGPVEIYEVYPAPEDELTYRRLVERDGVPTPPDELARKDREHLQKVEDWRRRAAAEGESERDARERELAEQRKKDRAQAQEALELFVFTIDRRERLDGHPAIVVRFEPKAGARPQSRETKVASRFAGEAWVHEHEYEIMRVDATAVDDVSFGWGLLARLHEGATALFIRRPVEGRWLPVETRFKGTGRALLFRRVSFDYVREYYDYAPYNPTELPAYLDAARPARK